MREEEQRKKIIEVRQCEERLLQRIRQLRNKRQCEYVLIRLSQLEVRTVSSDGEVGEVEKCEG